MEQMKKPHSHLKKQKQFFYITSAVMTFFLIGIVVFATLISYKVPWIYDMTKDKLFTLSPQTIEVLNTVTEPVKITAVYPEDKQDKMIVSLLEEYEKESNYIIVNLIDGEREPARLAQYQLNMSAVTNGTIIVKTEKKDKILMDSSFYTKTEAGNAFLGERIITGAIRSVTSVEMSKIYITEGHGETSLIGELSKAKQSLELNSYEIEEINLMKTDVIPKDAGLLLIASPKKDLTEKEKNTIEAYLNEGGNALFLVDAMSTNTMVLENFNQLLNSYGIDIHNNFVVEEDSNFYLSNNNMYLIPGYAYHSITEALAEDKNYVILPIAMGIRSVPVDKTICKVSPLLLTTEKSWLRADMTIQTGTRTEQDINGPIPVACAVVKSNAKQGEKDTRLVVIGNSSFIYNANIEIQANNDFFISCVNYLQGSREVNTISPKIINADTFLVRGNDFTKLAVICIGILPMIAFIGAYMVWRLRRNQ